MRKALVIVLLALLPFQFVWAVAAGYCQHEQGSEVSHFGHHSHKHQAKAAKASDASGDAVDQAGGEDADCMVCHLGGPTLVSAACDRQQGGGATPDLRSIEKGYSSPSMPTIYRPNW